MHVYLNHQPVAAAAAAVSVFDRGFMYGDALFETIKMMRGRPVFFGEHLERLRLGMAAVGYTGAPEPDRLRWEALSLAEMNGLGHLGRLRIMATRGTQSLTGVVGPDPAGELTPTWLITAEPFAGFPPEIYSGGLACRTVAANRGRFASLKSAGIITSVLARREVRAVGAHEAIFTSSGGRLLEGAFSNLFFLAGEVLVTAPEEEAILTGVTRGKVLGLAPELDLNIDLRAPRLEELGMGATSAFLTGSILGVCPVAAIDDVRLEPDPGPIAALRQRLAILEEESIRG